MPELPEVDWITGVVKRHAIDNVLSSIDVVRANKHYFGLERPGNALVGSVGIRDVFRVGKHVVIDVSYPLAPSEYLVVHNAMTGYFDWEHEPQTFDYVEGARASTETSVRVRLHFEDGKVLRFHDTRLFGRMGWTLQLPTTGPELMETPHMMSGRPVITHRQFRAALSASTKPVKHILMDQSVVAGIGNIYSSEACHVAGVDPLWPANLVPTPQVPLLLEALRGVVSHSIPKVDYSWLNVYRRDSCGSCARPIVREVVEGRATFSCRFCQWEPGDR